MAGETKAGTLLDAVTVTGRATIDLPRLPSMTLLFIKISGGTAAIQLEISDDRILFIPVTAVGVNAAIQFAIPASILAANVTSIAGATVTVTYRTVVLENIPEQTLLVYDGSGAGDVTSLINQPPLTIVSSEGTPERKKLAQAELLIAGAVLYTVPAAIITEIVHMRAVNTSALPASYIMWHDGTADVNMILPATTLLAGYWGEFDGLIEMQTGDTLRASSDTDNAITLTVYGKEFS